MDAKPRIVPSAAVDLLNRLTESLEIPFTLTDRDGTVIASTAGRPSGQADPYALAAARSGKPVNITEKDLQAPDAVSVSPAAEHAGLLPPAPGVYIPVRIGDAVAAVLFARGEPEQVHVKAITASAVAGLTLEFASTASDSILQTLGPDMAMRALLRGTQHHARRASTFIKVAGWDLLVPRTAMVITPAGGNDRLPELTHAVVRDLLNALLPNTPSGQLSANQIVALPALPSSDAQRSVEDIAREICAQLVEQGFSVAVGIGETHIDMPILPGLRRSYREAEFAATCGIRDNSEYCVHSLRSLGPIAFLAPSAGARLRLANRLLEPLRTAPEILETVRIFLEADLSMEGAAKQSGQHRHTIRTHLQRARELTGLDARILSDAVQLKLAFMLAPQISVQ